MTDTVDRFLADEAIVRAAYDAASATITKGDPISDIPLATWEHSGPVSRALCIKLYRAAVSAERARLREAVEKFKPTHDWRCATNTSGLLRCDCSARIIGYLRAKLYRLLTDPTEAAR